MNNLILKYLQNSLTLQEQHQLSKWLEEDEKNLNELKKVEVYWKDHSIDFRVKEESVKSRLLKRIEKDKVSARKITFYSTRNLMRIAAIMILGLTTAFTAYTIFDKQGKDQLAVSYVEKHSRSGEKLAIKLPDGSSVKLNSGSSITYPEFFTGNIREVELKGEGYFEVVKDENKPFIINVNKAMIKVLGTSFNVNSIRSSNKVVVGVKSGQVKVSNQSENVSRILNPNELVIFDNEDEQMKLQEISDQELVFGWIDQMLVFDDERVNEIFNTLSNWYGVEFILSRNIDNNRVFTSKYENPTLKSVLEGLSYVYDFDYEINDKTIIIK